ncbi:MAG: hypothetical protein LQ351_002232 [Letrouitia transgressa]|nr:MAG: hypothetical protein LQ351_002232 [Letrouitia transgressa]
MEMPDDARVPLSEAIASTPIDSHSEAGKAVVVIKDTKLGSNVSTIHYALVQDDTERVVGYASNTNLETEQGVSFPIPRPFGLRTPPSDLTKLLDGSDPDWVGYSVPWHPHSFLKGITHFQFFSPVKALSPQNTTEVWMRLSRDDERFTTEMLGSVADHWRRMIENYVPESAWNNEQLPKRAIQAAKEGRQILGYSTSYGYPTLAMHLEIKKKLPSQGVKWLFMGARSTEIKNGRFDAEVTIMDERMEVVALSHQISYITKSMQIADRKRSPKDSKL